MKTHCFLLFLVVTVACSSPGKKILEINPEKFSDNEITLSEIADDIKYIPLDKNYPMSIFYQLEILNDTIYIDEKDNGLFALDMTGKMIRKYGKRGRGPGEYIYGLRFTIDTISRTVYLLDQNNLIKYSLNGAFLGKFSIEEYGILFQDIKYYGSKILAFEYIMCGEARNDWIVIDTTGNLISRKPNYIPSFKTRYCAGGGVYEYENNISCWNWYNDTIFSISPDLSYRVSLLFSPGKLRYPRSDFDISQMSKYFIPQLVFETKSFIVFGYTYNRYSIVLINKEKNESFKAKGKGEFGGLRNDLDCGATFEPKQYYENGNREYMIGYTQPSDIIQCVNSNEFKRAVPKYPEKKEALKKLTANMKETDNAILTIVRLKN
jgi:hypothetical protein